MGDFVIQAGSCKQALAKFIAGFNDPETSSASVLGASLGSSPPCRSYRSLVLLSQFEEIEKDLQTCLSVQDIAAVGKRHQVFKSALRDLLSMCKAATTRLTNAVKSALKEIVDNKSKATAVGNDNKRRKKGTAATAVSLIEFAHSECDDIPSIVLDANAKPATVPDLLAPVIFRLSPDYAPAKEGGPFHASAVAFGKKFQKDATRNDPGRAQRICTDEVIEKMRGFVEAAISTSLSKAKLSAACAKDVSAMAFAVAANRATSSAEAGHLASIRITTKGTRQLVCIRTMAAVEFLQAKDRSANVDMKQVGAWLKSATLDSVKAFKVFCAASAKASKTYYASIGVGDALFIPCGWFFFEQVGGQDVVGVRASVLRQEDADVMQDLNRLLLAIEKPNEVLSRAIDCLALAA